MKIENFKKGDLIARPVEEFNGVGYKYLAIENGILYCEIIYHRVTKRIGDIEQFRMLEGKKKGGHNDDLWIPFKHPAEFIEDKDLVNITLMLYERKKELKKAILALDKQKVKKINEQIEMINKYFN